MKLKRGQNLHFEMIVSQFDVSKILGTLEETCSIVRDLTVRLYISKRLSF
jgi:hypothetical protein